MEERHKDIQYFTQALQYWPYSSCENLMVPLTFYRYPYNSRITLGFLSYLRNLQENPQVNLSAIG